MFTNSGEPKVESLKGLIDPDFGPYYLLYIQEFMLPYEYRSLESTVGPNLIKSMLWTFGGWYSIALYIPYKDTQFTMEEADARRYREKFTFRDEDERTDEEIQAEEEQQKRHEVLREQDMRQFFKAGFHQVNDRSIIETSEYSYVFTTPKDAEKPILSVEDALNKPIARKTPTKPEATGLARELQLFVKKKAIEWNGMVEELKRLRDPSWGF